MRYLVIISCLTTSRVWRGLFLTRAEALEYARQDRWFPRHRSRKGYRMEMYEIGNQHDRRY